jgi:hypothetical protein
MGMGSCSGSTGVPEHVAILLIGHIVHLVPHSAFPSKEAMNAFVVYARQKAADAMQEVQGEKE